MARDMTKRANTSEFGNKPKVTFRNLLRSYWRMYCEKSSVHGVRYLYDSQLHRLERLIWAALLIACVTATCIFYLLLADRYNAQKLQTVVEDPQYPVFYLPFPAVALCTDNRIDWSKLDEAKEIFLPSNAEKNIVELFTTLVTRIETFRFGNFEKSFSNLGDLNLDALHFVNITLLSMFLAPQCEDVLMEDSCYWRRIAFNCCEYFLLEKTEYGFCLAFNSELSPDAQKLRSRDGNEFYPKHNSKAGQGTGLNFDILLPQKFMRPNSTATDSIYIMIKKPDQLSSDVYSMSPDTETYITVRPELTNTDANVRSVTPEKRGCEFSDEHVRYTDTKHFGQELMLTNCMHHCHEDYIVRLCNCTIRSFFLDNVNAIDCNATHFRCLAEHNDVFSYDKRQEEDAFFSATKLGMTCYCLVNCNLIEYFSAPTTLPLYADVALNNTSSKYYKVDVHYQTEFIVKYRTSLEFTSIDLIANFGGIFGLCLGASLVSAVELIYYLTIGFQMYLYDNGYFTVFRKEFGLKYRKIMRYVRNDGRLVTPTNHINTIQVQQYKMPHPRHRQQTKYPSKW